MIDWDRVRELRQDLGDDDFGEVAELFLEEVETVLERLDLQRGRDLADDLHFIKGSAANLGFSKLQNLCVTARLEDGTVTARNIQSCYAQSKACFLMNAASEDVA